MVDRGRLGKPEEEGAASSSTQSASGLGGGTPEGGPAEGRDMEREERGRDGVGYDRGKRGEPAGEGQRVEGDGPEDPEDEGSRRRKT